MCCTVSLIFPVEQESVQLASDAVAETKAGSQSTVDVELFNDDDFYHQMLRELIEQRTNKSDDPVAMSRCVVIRNLPSLYESLC